MIDIYLFDWGDTLMVDLPDKQGKMCDWDIIEAVSGAEETLAFLSKESKIYIATGAAESIESDIKKAFDRAGLSKYISGYFCKSNLGISKGTAQFYKAILSKISKEASDVAMVGDSLENDIIPASKVGIKTFWLTSEKIQNLPNNTSIIFCLRDLCRNNKLTNI
jgi:FMN phosphatase YigB (HAD superfamily)